jgi:hypothetical protein
MKMKLQRGAQTDNRNYGKHSYNHPQVIKITLFNNIKKTHTHSRYLRDVT